MLNKFILTVVTVVIFSIIFAHGDHGDGHSHGHRKRDSVNICQIKGIILDSKTDIPIEYASVSLLGKNNNIITGTVSDKDGEFLFRELPSDTYSLKIEFMGFESLQVEDINLSLETKKNFDAGILKLNSVVLVTEAVQVIDKKPIFEFEADKIIYNSADDIVAESGTAEDVLNKVPMVTVDSEGEISLRGNPNVKILVNGRPNRTGTAVDNIPASLIDKVEIITSPSAKYDPEGMAGIINIQLKKGRFEGLNGSVRFGAKHNQFNSVDDLNSISLNTNYQTGKTNIYGSLSQSNRGQTQSGFRRSYYDDCHPSHPNPENCQIYQGDYNYSGDVFNYYDSYSYQFENEGTRNSKSLSLGSDYSYNEFLNFNGEIIYTADKKLRTINQDYIQRAFDDNTPFTKISSEGKYDWDYHLESFFEINKSYKIPKKELYFSFSNHFSEDNEFESLDTLLSDVVESEDNYEIDFSFKYPFNNNILEIGYDGRFLDTDEKLNFELLGLNGINDFKMKRNIHALYFENQTDYNEQFSFKVSMRYEGVDKDIFFDALNYNYYYTDLETPEFIDSTSSSYALILNEGIYGQTSVKEFNFFPNLNISYNITDKKNIQFGISRRIERPGGGSHGSWGQLRPFPRNVYNDSFLFIGKPDLEPEFSTQYEISYKSPITGGFYYTNIFYRKISNSIEWYDYDGIDNSINANIITFRNAEQAKDMGLEFFLMIMGQTIGGGYNITELNDSSNDFQLNGKNERLNLFMRINLPEKYLKLLGFEFGFYWMKLKTPGGTLFGENGSLWANTGISKSFSDKRVTCSFTIDNILDQGGFQMFVWDPVKDDNSGNILKNNGDQLRQYTDVSSSRGGRTFSISLKYNFGKLQDEKQKGSRQSLGQGAGQMDMGY